MVEVVVAVDGVDDNALGHLLHLALTAGDHHNPNVAAILAVTETDIAVGVVEAAAAAAVVAEEGDLTVPCRAVPPGLPLPTPTVSTATDLRDPSTTNVHHRDLPVVAATPILEVQLETIRPDHGNAGITETTMQDHRRPCHDRTIRRRHRMVPTHKIKCSRTNRINSKVGISGMEVGEVGATGTRIKAGARTGVVGPTGAILREQLSLVRAANSLPLAVRLHQVDKLANNHNNNNNSNSNNSSNSSGLPTTQRNSGISGSNGNSNNRIGPGISKAISREVALRTHKLGPLNIIRTTVTPTLQTVATLAMRRSDETRHTSPDTSERLKHCKHIFIKTPVLHK